MDRAVLVLLRRLLALPIIAEFDAIEHTICAVAQRRHVIEIGIDLGALEGAGGDLGFGKGRAVDVGGRLVAGGRVLGGEGFQVAVGVVGHIDGHVFVGRGCADGAVDVVLDGFDHHDRHRRRVGDLLGLPDRSSCRPDRRRCTRSR